MSSDLRVETFGPFGFCNSIGLARSAQPYDDAGNSSSRATVVVDARGSRPGRVADACRDPRSTPTMSVKRIVASTRSESPPWESRATTSAVASIAHRYGRSRTRGSRSRAREGHRREPRALGVRRSGVRGAIPLEGVARFEQPPASTLLPRRSIWSVVMRVLGPETAIAASGSRPEVRITAPTAVTSDSDSPRLIA